MVVTADELELPLFIADNIKDIADYLGVKKQSVSAAITKGCNGSKRGYKVVRVKVK